MVASSLSTIPVFSRHVIILVLSPTWSRKCKRIELKIEDNGYVHSMLSADGQVGITGGAEDANYMGRKLEKNMRNGDLNYE
jgi:hypothetical protein